MKTYKITVNGKVYEVTVEEASATETAAVKAAPAAPVSTGYHPVHEGSGRLCGEEGTDPGHSGSHEAGE